MSEAGDFETVNQFRIGQEWLIENPGANRLVKVRICGVTAKALHIEEHDAYFGYSRSREEWVARDRVRFIEKLSGK